MDDRAERLIEFNRTLLARAEAACQRTQQIITWAAANQSRSVEMRNWAQVVQNQMLPPFPLRTPPDLP